MIELPPTILQIILNFSIGLIVTVSLNIEVGFLNLPQFGRLLAVLSGAIVAAAVPGRILAASMGLPWDANYAYHLYNFGIVAKINNMLSENPGLSIGILVFTLVIVALIGGLIGYLSAYPALRLKEAYLGITLLAFGELLMNVAWNYDPLVGGTMGVWVVDPFRFVGAGGARFTFAALFIFFIAIAIYIYAELLARSPFGRTLKAVRDAEVAASVYGKDIVKIRTQTLIVGGSIAAIAGALWAFFTGSMKAATYTRLTWTFWPWAFMMLGGIGNNLGVLFGVFLYTVSRTAIILYKGTLSAVIPIDPEWLEYIMIGLVLVAVVLFRPQGIIPERPTLTLPEHKIEMISKKFNREEK
ncbi:MAG: branched-chain amino acid ABC transporter permease [Sulfolobales archaeon]|nr:branched-chain amino acid ABC transporter permease [Sulfolobales archaeon]MDW8083285.1 branched-chain amino acid ABC transporter permease [Sulfolobales archaeon]